MKYKLIIKEVHKKKYQTKIHNIVRMTFYNFYFLNSTLFKTITSLKQFESILLCFLRLVFKKNRF